MRQNHAMPDPERVDQPTLHQFKNNLSIIVGYCELLLIQTAENDPRREDMLELEKAAHASLALMPELEKLISRP